MTRAPVVNPVEQDSEPPPPDDADLAPGVGRELVLRCDYTALLRGYLLCGETCEIDGLGPVPVELAHEFLQDCFLKAILCDGTDIKRVAHFGRKIPAVLKTALGDRSQSAGL